MIIFTKEYWYGINIYAVTDAETEFDLNTIMYTGKYTYAKNDNTGMLETVKVVYDLCKPF